MNNIISLENISYSYPSDNGEGDIKLFDRLSLGIERGSFTVLLGHNGSGKSTLAKMFNGMLLPDGGTVTIDGMSTADEENELKIRRTVGLVFQNPDNQIVSSVVEEDVAFGPENLGIAPDEIRKRVDYALRAVDMYDYRGHSTYKLSGGQKQRVAIAGILAMRPRCIVLDEPTSMLDPKGRREVLDVLTRLNREEKMTVVMITHYMNEAVEADRAVVLNSGKITADGTPEEIFSQHRIISDAGLFLPQPAFLASELQKAGIRLPGGILTVDDCADALIKILK